MQPEFDRITHAFRQRPPFPMMGAQRLFNGFTEGWKQVVIERYADALVLFIHAKAGEDCSWLPNLLAHLQQLMPDIQTILVKHRHSQNASLRKGELPAGNQLPEQLEENSVHYAIDLRLNQDASFYLDTRSLRTWLKENMQDRTMLNTFAYTGSLGVAALAGGARQVVQTDNKRAFLALSTQSTALNNSPQTTNQLLVGDFFRVTANLRRQEARFDCVVLDPPFFAAGSSGQVDLQHNLSALINKVRPLVRDGGCLVTVNNALFVSGRDYIQTLTDLTGDGYLQIETLLPVHADCTGYPETIVGVPPADPAPFNHATKIAVLRVKKNNPGGMEGTPPDSWKDISWEQ